TIEATDIAERNSNRVLHISDAGPDRVNYPQEPHPQSLTPYYLRSADGVHGATRKAEGIYPPMPTLCPFLNHPSRVKVDEPINLRAGSTIPCDRSTAAVEMVPTMDRAVFRHELRNRSGHIPFLLPGSAEEQADLPSPVPSGGRRPQARGIRVDRRRTVLVAVEV